MPPRASMVAEVLVLLRERIADWNFSSPGIEPPRETRLERHDVIAPGALLAKLRAAEPRLALTRVELNQSVIVAFGFLKVPQEPLHGGAIVQVARSIHFPADGLVIRLKGFGIVFEHGKQIPKLSEAGCAARSGARTRNTALNLAERTGLPQRARKPHPVLRAVSSVFDRAARTGRRARGIGERRAHGAIQSPSLRRARVRGG